MHSIIFVSVSYTHLDKDQNNDKEQTPDKSEQGKNPQTSDETNILPFAGLASLALITGVGVFLKKKKED